MAALDWNFNVKRKYKLTKSGDHLYKSKVGIFLKPTRLHKTHLNFQIDRAGKKMTVVPVKEAKDMRFQDLIFTACIKALENDSIPEVDVGSYSI